MYTNAKISEQLAVLAIINPVSQAAGTVTTGWVNTGNSERILALVQTGVLGTSATVDAKIQQASDASGTGAKDVTGKAITQIVKATGDNRSAMINLRPEELDTNNGYEYIRVSLTVGTAASQVGLNLLGAVAKDAPVSQSLVAEIVG
jgi:hypothetical protein